LKRAFERQFGGCQNLQIVQADIRGPLDLPTLDGVLMANSLHFFREKVGILSKVREMLKPMGQLILIEYNVDNGNAWVPFPISFGRLPALLAKAGFEAPRLLAKHPSSFLREFYSALARRR
jgi:SAM-dependent methyltransferase